MAKAKKAQIGDSIRITQGRGWYSDKVGEVYEAITKPDRDGDVFVEHPENTEGCGHFVSDGDYEITTYAEPVTQAERISALCDEVKALLIRKNNDYGDSFGKQFEKRGMLGALIRMEDKMSRLDKLVSGHEAEVDESIDDTLRDLIGYATLTMVERRKAEEKETQF